MVARKNGANDFDANAKPTESPEGWEWETVEEGAATQVVFDTVGDTFIGQYKGRQEIIREPAADGSDQSFALFNFLGRDGDKYAINSSYALDEGMASIDVGLWVRITFIKEVPTARKLNPLKSFRIDVRK